MNIENSGQSYSAKEAYRDYSVAENYEAERFSGIFGQYRHRREQKAIARLVNRLPTDIVVADCPCGTGRWWPILALRARRIIAIDVSEGMLQFARTKREAIPIDIVLSRADAEMIPLPNDSVDYVFSHALTKHLPVRTQQRVLCEFSRVARVGVICSFGIFGRLSYRLWKYRQIAESHPSFIDDLESMASVANLKITEKHKCTTALGVEHTVLFKKTI